MFSDTSKSSEFGGFFHPAMKTAETTLHLQKIHPFHPLHVKRTEVKSCEGDISRYKARLQTRTVRQAGTWDQGPSAAVLAPAQT